MDETIIIYTQYFSEAVIEVLDKYDLSIQVICFSSYDQVLEYTKKTPNLRGIIFLEHKPRRSSFKAYQRILQVADEVAGATRQPFCVSILSNTDLPLRFLTKISTRNLHILFTKFVMFNTDLLRFEGLAAVIANTIGVANETILLQLQKEEEVLHASTSRNKIDFLRYCLQITTCKKEELEELKEVAERFPELEKLIHLRKFNDKDEEILESSENLFNIFCKQCIARRIEDEEKSSSYY